jgi:hypothetical protein
MLFLTDRHRRVLANLSQPRSVPLLARELLSDPYSGFTGSIGLVADQVDAFLAELAAEGLVARLGYFDRADELVEHVDAHVDVPSLHPEKAENFIERANRRQYMLAEGELWMFTQAGYEALNG